MRISYLLPDLGFTGGSQVLYQFMERLTLRDHEVYLVTPGGRLRWRPGMTATLNSKRNDPLFGDAAGRFFADVDLEAVDSLARSALGINSGPIAISSLVTSSVTEALMRHWIPSDITVATHNFTAYAAFHLMDRTLSFYHMQAYEEPFSQDSCLQKTARMTYFLPLRAIANSSWLGRRVAELSGRRCRLLTPGIDTAVFRPLPEDACKYDPCGEFRVLSFYSPAPHKGWNDAVAAMRLAAAGSRRRLRWVVLGGRPDPVPGIDMDLKGRVFGADLARIYSACHACLVPSWMESFPLPPLEAMACGTAVVTTPVGTEDYVRNGRNALTAPAKDPRSMADALLRLEGDPGLCFALTEGGVKTARSYGWDSAVKSLELIFAGAVADSSKDRFAELMSELAPGGPAPAGSVN